MEHPNCKKLVYKNSSDVNLKDTVLLGLILDNDGYFIRFKTARREYLINRSAIISIEDTDQPFREAQP